MQLIGYARRGSFARIARDFLDTFQTSLTSDLTFNMMTERCNHGLSGEMFSDSTGRTP